MLADSTDATTFEYTFANGQTAHILNISKNLSYTETLAALGLSNPSSSMVVIGGASKMSSESKLRVSQLFSQVLAPIAETYKITVFDGGTDAGVIQMMGQARQHINGSFNLVGIAPKAKVYLPGYPLCPNHSYKETELINLEEHHTHFALIPGLTWGSESPWLANCAAQFSQKYPAITILINGGKISLSDLMLNLSVGRQTIVVAGSGRLADDISSIIHGNTSPETTKDSVIQDLANTYYPSQISIFEMTQSLENLREVLKNHFRDSHPL
ncbi:MAG: hypothetical protein AAF572_24855 [Cyanobacteria bacterium P01_B01_bin.77]